MGCFPLSRGIGVSSKSLLSPGSSALASCVETYPEDSASESCCVFPRFVFLGFLIAVTVVLAVVAGGVTGSLLDDILAVQQISASHGRRDLGKWIWQVVVA